MHLQCTLHYKRTHCYPTTYANSIIRGPGSRDRMRTFGKGNSGSKYRVDEVCDACTNSADHNRSNAAYCYRRRGVVSAYVMGITAKMAEPIEMPFGSDCAT